MAKLIYTGITSLDGYIADEDGNFAWSAPDEEVHSFINDLEREVGTHLYGRRLYEVMKAWEDFPDLESQPAHIQAFADIWQNKSKLVYSTTLDKVSTAHTELKREFVPEAIRKLKADAKQDISVGGPELASHALRAGLVDELLLFVNPVLVGGGKSFLPDDLRLNLKLHDQHQFSNGVVYLRYEIKD